MVSKDTQTATEKTEAKDKTEESSAPRGKKKMQPRLLGRPYFQRRKTCPFTGPKALDIDYKDMRLLNRFTTEHGKIIPSHITGACYKKQRELATAIKRARILALLPFSNR